MGILAYGFLLPYNFLFSETAGFRLNAPASPSNVGLNARQLQINPVKNCADCWLAGF
ncbi:hypothetical protein METHB2_1150004 [Candidatus Methylobacter favarea]|uniref:Uncharacterized protein n=1 Tax=Candidatus Methylobacter favarea TaxID=2707345 RepID=A0A8S0XHE1_9GAMM|nr:hypothetical protein METHB2_1150004 [Candidatus Methylobacter favarea]